MEAVHRAIVDVGATLRLQSCQRCCITRTITKRRKSHGADESVLSQRVTAHKKERRRSNDPLARAIRAGYARVERVAAPLPV
eukprot:3161899-Pyramimonas_sp.AAC.1